MDWNPTDTVTIGSLLAGIIVALIFMLRNMGERTDPALIKLLNKHMDSADRATELFNKLDDNMDRLSITLEALSTNTGNLVTEVLKQINAERRSNLEEHNRIVDKLGDLFAIESQSSKQIIGQLDTTTKSMTQMESSLGEAIHIMSDIRKDTQSNTEIIEMLVGIRMAIDSLTLQLSNWGEENREKEQAMQEEIKGYGVKIAQIEKRITQETPSVPPAELPTEKKRLTDEMKKIGSKTQPITPAKKPTEKDQPNENAI